MFRVFLYGFLMLPLLSLSSIASNPQPSSLSLHEGWQFRAVGSTQHADVQNWHPATVPGVVQADLLANKLIADPFYRANEKDVQWVGLTDWEYQTEFDVEPKMLERGHLELVFEGLDTFAEVYVNGTQILSADNMFRGWRVPVKDKVHSGKNTLRVVLHSPIQYMLPKVRTMSVRVPSVAFIEKQSEEGIATDPYTRKAAYNYGWDWAPRIVTLGIWKPVRLLAWDDVRIDDAYIRQESVTAERANVTAEVEVEATAPGEVTVSVEAEPAAGGKAVASASQTAHVETGTNRLRIPVMVKSPSLWFPNGYGAQPMYAFNVQVANRGGVADRATVRTGLRSLEVRRQPDQWGKSFTFVVNGIPVFAKGADVVPFDSLPTRVTKEKHRYFLQAAKDAHMNMLRVWGGGYYESDDFYELCDEMGIMIWQDFMFGGAMIPGGTEFQENVRQEAIDQVKRLRNHPSLALWSGNNEVETGWKYWGDRQSFKETITPPQRERVWQDYLVMFHDIIKSVVAEYGAPTPYWPSSPSTNLEDVPKGESSGDMHYWDVWHGLKPVYEYLAQHPRFMSEFGFQSFPDMATIRRFAQPEDMDLLTPVMQEHQKNDGGNEKIRTYLLREFHEPKDFESFVYVSQVLQAEVIKTGAEHLRRQRPQTMGALYWQLNDCWPVASWSSIDYNGHFKALQYYAQRFYNDVLVSAWEEDSKLNVSVVSDRTAPTSADLRVRVIDFSGKTLFEKRSALIVPELSSHAYATFTRDELLRGTDARHAVMIMELMSGDRLVSRNVYALETTRNLALPSPQIKTELTGTNGVYTLTLGSPVLARHVYVSFGDSDATLSDNYFDLLPNERTSISVKSDAPIDQLKKSIKVRDITTAFMEISTR